MRVVARTCKDCGKPLEAGQERFCSISCHTNYRSLDHSPEVWDGTTAYSRHTARNRYEAKCLQCARPQGRDVLLSDLEVRSLGTLPRCFNCGGNVGLEPADIGGIASPFAARRRMGAKAWPEWSLG